MEYEEISLIKQSERCTIHLVYEKCEGHFFIRKVLRGVQHIYQTLQGCSHPCLPKVYDVTIADGITTVIEEYIEGQSLGLVSMSRKQFQVVVKDLCSALEYLHARGIIHRDIKPSNIIFKKDGHICLIDFDAARMPKDDLEQDTRLLGTRGYAPPEQYGFSQTDARADIYSLGVTFNQVMEGQHYRSWYGRVIRKCMNLNPDRRYQTVRQVRRAFFPAKRNTSFILVILVLTALFRNEIETISKNLIRNDVQMGAVEGNSNTKNMIGRNTKTKVEKENTGSIEILFADSPVYGYLGQPIEDIIGEKGEPELFEKSGGSTSICKYPGMEFHFDDYRGVYNMMFDTDSCTYDNQLLKKNRAELIALLNNPSNEGWVNIYSKGYNIYSRLFDYNSDNSYSMRGNVYCMEYKDFDKDIDISFYSISPNEQAYVMMIE